jgi:hypothetical protein
VLPPRGIGSLQQGHAVRCTSTDMAAELKRRLRSIALSCTNLISGVLVPRRPSQFHSWRFASILTPSRINAGILRTGSLLHGARNLPV